MSGVAQNSSSADLQDYSGDQVTRTASALIILEVLVVMLKSYAKTLTEAPLGMNDYLLIPALVSNLAICVLGIVVVKVAAVGYHQAAVMIRFPEATERWSKCLVALQYLYAFATAFGKMSILFFFLRIFPNKSFRMAVYLLMFLVSGLCIAIVFTSIFQCSPVAYAWDKKIRGGMCINEQAYFRYLCLPNVFTDAVMLVLPLPLVWKLHNSTSQKIGLTFIFLTGSVGIVASCVRTSLFFQKEAFEDVQWTAVPLITWTIIEPGFYLIAACLPSLRPLLVHVKPRIWGLVLSIKAGNRIPFSGSSEAAGERNAQFEQINGADSRSWGSEISSGGITRKGTGRPILGRLEENEIPLGVMESNGDVNASTRNGIIGQRYFE